MNKEACEDLISPLPTLDNSSLFNFSEKRPRGFPILSKKHLARSSQRCNFIGALMSYERISDSKRRGSSSSSEFAEDDKEVPLPCKIPLLKMAESNANFDGPSLATTGSSKLSF